MSDETSYVLSISTEVGWRFYVRVYRVESVCQSPPSVQKFFRSFLEYVNTKRNGDRKVISLVGRSGDVSEEGGRRTVVGDTNRSEVTREVNVSPVGEEKSRPPVSLKRGETKRNDLIYQ